MKFNKKLVVTALSTVLGLGIVGSISGTVAWYQYSTRSTAAFVGTAVKSTGNLEMSLDGTNFKSVITSEDVNDYLEDVLLTNANVSPITTGVNSEANAALSGKFYSNPVYQGFDYSEWSLAKASEYVKFNLTLRYLGVNDSAAAATGLSGKKIYLNDFMVSENASNTKLNISDAVRVHLGSTNSMLLSNGGQTTTLGGNLDLGGEAGPDTNGKWEEFTGAGTVTAYGDESFKQKTYKIGDVKPSMVDNVLTDNALAGDQYLGVTDSNGKLVVTVTIWLEGWQELHSEKTVTVGDSVTGLFEKDSEGNFNEITDSAAVAEDGKKYYGAASADWSEADYLNAVFNVGLEFIVERV